MQYMKLAAPKASGRPYPLGVLVLKTCIYSFRIMQCVVLQRSQDLTVPGETSHKPLNKYYALCGTDNQENTQQNFYSSLLSIWNCVFQY